MTFSVSEPETQPSPCSASALCRTPVSLLLPGGLGAGSPPHKFNAKAPAGRAPQERAQPGLAEDAGKREMGLRAAS